MAKDFLVFGYLCLLDSPHEAPPRESKSILFDSLRVTAVDAGKNKA